MSTASAVTTCSVTAGGPKTRLTAPGGNPASSMSRTRATVQSTPRGEGISTAEQPDAKAGPSFQEMRLIG